MSIDQFNMTDSKRAPGFYVDVIEMEIVEDDMTTCDEPEADDGRYEGMSEAEKAEAHTADLERYQAWINDHWHYVGTRALAHCMVVGTHGAGQLFTLRSAGLWGTENDAGEAHFAEIFAEEKSALIAMIEAMRDPVFGDGIKATA